MKNRLNYIISIHLLFSSLLFSQTTTFGDGAGTQGVQSSFFGYQSGKNNTANYNTFIGVYSGGLNTTGLKNTFIGRQAGKSNTTGNQNTFIGSDAGLNNTTASFNVFIGDGAGIDNKTGSMNSFIGTVAGAKNTSGQQNSFHGILSGYSNITGSGNTFLGYQAGYKNKTGSNNVFVGRQAGYNELGSNKLYIENSTMSTPLIYGDFSSNQIGINTKNISAGISFAVKGNSNFEGTIKGTKALLVGNAQYEDTGIQGKHYAINSEGGPVKITDDLLPKLEVRSSKPDVGSWVDLGVSTSNGWGSKFAKKGSVVMRAVSYNGDFYITNPGNTGITFATGHWNVAENPQKERMTITNTGNVGIGTLTPDEKLAVNGNIHAKEVTVDLIGWPDYVFENTYNLPTLQQVENHIQEKGHLVNIPSAKEVEEKGIQLGEMNKKLLEKIEELTLYTIAQDKQLKELKSTRAQQKTVNDQLKTLNQNLEARLTKIEALLTKN